MERRVREGGNSNSSSGGTRNEDVNGIGVGDRQHNGRGSGRNRGGGVPRSERAQWSGVERSGAGQRTTNILTFIGQETTAVTEAVTIKLKRDRV